MGEMAHVAINQLKEWERTAATWEWYTDGRANRCTECHQNIWFTADPRGHKYQYAEYEILALKVAHIRQVHSEAIGRK